jgi:plasmid stabilization system protein ParE
MTLAIAVLDQAVSDIIAAGAWYEQQREGLGSDFVSEVNHAIDLLAEQALFYRIRYRRKNVRWSFPRRFPYRICYYVEAQTVHVFAVVHAARHDREWKRRL